VGGGRVGGVRTSLKSSMPLRKSSFSWVGSSISGLSRILREGGREGGREGRRKERVSTSTHQCFRFFPFTTIGLLDLSSVSTSKSPCLR